MRILFFGTSEFAVPSLKKLLSEKSNKIVSVVSQSSKPSGRSRKIAPSLIESIVHEYELNIFTPDNINTDFAIEYIKSLDFDLIIVVAYGQFIPQKIINLARYGAINIHPSLLPKYRGAAPIQWALINGDNEIGVSIIDVIEQMDAGDILRQSVFKINHVDNFISLQDKLSQEGALMLLDTINDIKENKINRIPQDKSKVSFAPKLKKENGIINWNQSAVDIVNKIRAFNPWPGCQCLLPNNKRLFVWNAIVKDINGDPGQFLDDNLTIATSSKAIQLIEIQLEGRKRITAKDFLNGHSYVSGDRMLNF